MTYRYEDPLVWQMRYRLMQANDYDESLDPAPWDHPAFKSIDRATKNLLGVYPDARRFLVMDDLCLRVTRDRVLLADRSLVIPSDDGTGLLEVPKSAMTASEGTGQLRCPPRMNLNVLTPYHGPIDIVVVSCLGFHPRRRRLYSFELAKTARVIASLRMEHGRAPPVAVLASDAQQISGWPARALGAHGADLVITSTRAILLGSGQERRFSAVAGTLV